jgi:CIC family chloride channel protein
MKRQKFRINLLSWLLHFGFAKEGIFYVVTILVGLLAGLTAVSFHLSIAWLQEFLFGSSHLTTQSSSSWLLIILIPALGAFIAAILLKYVVPDARGSGIPQTKIAYAVHSGHIPKKVWIGKFLVGIINIGSGSSLGREGPTVQICSGMASWIGEMFSMKRQRIKSLIPIGAAAGIAAAFNTPIAAITFTLEEIVGDLNARVLGSIVLASVTAAVVQRSILGNEPVFLVPEYTLENPLELLIYALVGIFCALTGIIFCKTLLYIRSRCIKVSSWKSVLLTTIGGLCIGIIGLQFPQIFGVGYPFVNKALSGSYTLYILSILLVLKLIATSISYGTGSCGGIFAPTLFLGAMAGGSVASVMEIVFPSIIGNSGSYALVGMGAAFASVIRAPMTSVLIIFELTQDYNVILALMIANTISFSLSKYWQPESIYGSLSHQDGIALPNYETDHILHEIHVEDAMVTDVKTLSNKCTVREAIEETRNLAYSGYPILDENKKLEGMISRYDFRQAQAIQKEDGKITEFATTKYVLHAHPDQSLDSVMAKLGSRRISRLPVVSREDPTRLLGIITSEDVILAFGKVKIQRDKD